MRELFLGLGLSSACQSGKRERERLKGYGGVFIPLSPKLAVEPKVTRRLRVYARKLRENLYFSRETVTRSLRAMGSVVYGPIPGVFGLGREELWFLLF